MSNNRNYKNNRKPRNTSETGYNYYSRRPSNRRYDYFDINVYHCLTLVAVVVAVIALIVSLVTLTAKAATMAIEKVGNSVVVTNDTTDPVTSNYIIIATEPDWEYAFNTAPYVENRPEEAVEEEVNYGDDIISTSNATLVRYELPSSKYSTMDFQSMQTFMNFRTAVTKKGTSAYDVCWSENAYTDDHGFRRYRTSDEQFTIDGHDDYVVALGNYYKTKGLCGERYLIVTTTGAYTAITGDEKDDRDTDQYKMGHIEAGKMSMIEFVVDDWSMLDDMMRKMGSARYSSIEAFQGDILYIYKITENTSL